MASAELVLSGGGHGLKAHPVGAGEQEGLSASGRQQQAVPRRR